MTDVVLKGLNENEYTALKVAYAESRHKYWKDFVLEAVKKWKESKNKQELSQ